MDLRNELENFAHDRASESGNRLRGAGVRVRLDARVTRGRRVQNAKVGVGTVAAVGVLAAGAVMVPRLGLGESAPGAAPTMTKSASIATPSATPPPSEMATPSVPEVSELPVLGTSDYLASAVVLWNAPGPLTCDALAASQPEKGVGYDMQGQRVPLPSWIETGRLYGWGDDVLVGGTPIPLAASSQADGAGVKALVSDYQAGSAELVMTGSDGTVWGFTVSWSERDDLPHDAPGMFVTLEPDYDCNDGIPAAGVYDARMAFTAGDGSTQVVTLASITVTDGVPSLPEVDAAGR